MVFNLTLLPLPLLLLRTILSIWETKSHLSIIYADLTFLDVLIVS